MNSDFIYYFICLVAAIMGFMVIKKVTSCMFKTLATIVVAIILAAIYFLYIKQ